MIMLEIQRMKVISLKHSNLIESDKTTSLLLII